MAKILVTDDSTFMRQLLISILKRAGHNDIIEAKNGVEALDICKKEKPDLLLLDIIMPEMDGIEVLKNLSPSQKVVMVTAIGQDAVLKEATALGAKGYIIKPFDSKQIIAEVEKNLK